MKEIGVYVHIPFCKAKCYYCDFVSFSNQEELIEKYIRAFEKEIMYKSNDNYIVKTIYIGGGTPSYIDEKYIKDIMHVIRKNYKIVDEAEITIEVNPGTVDEDKLKTYLDLGINRLSIGLQSANNSILKSIGRIHTFEQYNETVRLAKKVGFKNINSDIIIGLPNQTLDDVKYSIKKLINLDLNHISVYSLIVEEGTVLAEKIENGELNLPDEETERKMYWTTEEMLEEAGYIHYEISNFAKPGYVSKHNWDCWKQKEYLGFGLNASSYENGIRYSNISDLCEYIKKIEVDNYKENKVIEEQQNIQEQMNEYMILGLRKIEGVSISKFENKYEINPLELYEKQLKKLESEGLIKIETDNIKLSKKGIDLANLVWEEFI